MVNTKSIHHLSAFTGVLAVLFALFFQVSKGGPFRDINPFGVDPYDAVGSFAFQGALLLGVLTYARALRLCADPSQAFKVRYIRRGSGARGGSGHQQAVICALFQHCLENGVILRLQELEVVTRNLK